MVNWCQYAVCGLPSLKLTNIAPRLDPCKRKFLLETTIFRGYVSFREGSIPRIQDWKSNSKLHRSRAPMSTNDEKHELPGTGISWYILSVSCTRTWDGSNKKYRAQSVGFVSSHISATSNGTTSFHSLTTIITSADAIYIHITTMSHHVSQVIGSFSIHPASHPE